MSNKTIVLIAASLAVFFTSLMSSSLNVALPTISNEFNANAILLGWIVTGFVLASAVFSLPSGRIADIVGLKRIFLFGMIIFAATSAIALFSTSATMLVACRAFQGFGGAMAAVNSLALVTAVFPAEDRGRALGINLASVYVGSSVGPFIGGVLTQYLGWRSIFAVNIPADLIVIVLLVWKVKGEWCESKGEKFDYTGSIIYGIGLIVLMYGFSILPAISGGVMVFLGIGGLIAFAAWEYRAKSPVLNLRVFRNNRPFVFSNLAALTTYSSIFAISFLMSLYLQDIKGLSPEIAGLVLLSQPTMQATLSPLAGRLSDKVEPRVVASSGLVLIFAGLLLLSLIGKTTSFPQIIGSLVLVGTGFALFSSPNTNAIMSSVTPKFYGVASAAMSTMRSGGQMLSMGIAMIVIAVIMGRVTIVPQTYQTFLSSAKIIFMVFASLSFIGIFASLIRGKVR